MSGGRHPGGGGPNQPYGFMAFGPMSPPPQPHHPQIQHQHQMAMANPNPYGPVLYPPPPHSPPVLHPQQPQQQQHMIAFYPGNPIPYVISAQPQQGQGRPHSQRVYPAMTFGYPYPPQQVTE